MIIKREPQAEMLLQKAFAGRLRYRGMAPEHDNLRRVGYNPLGRVLGCDEDRLQESFKCFSIADRLAGRLRLGSSSQMLAESEALLGRISRPTTDAKVDQGRSKTASNLLDETLINPESDVYKRYVAHALKAKYFVGEQERDMAAFHLNKAWEAVTQPSMVIAHHVADLLDFVAIHSILTPAIQEVLALYQKDCPRCQGGDLRKVASYLAQRVRALSLTVSPDKAHMNLNRLVCSSPPPPPNTPAAD